MSLAGWVRSRWRLLGVLLLLVSLLPLPHLLSYYPRRILILSMIFVVLTVSLNIVAGYAGQMSLGQSAFYTIGAYASAVLATKAGAPFWVALLVAAAAATLSGVVVGLPSFRVRGIYLAILTLMFAGIVFLVVLNLRRVTGGASGVLGIPRPHLGPLAFNTDLRYYYLVLGLAVVTVAAAHRLAHSPLGRALMAIRDDETAAGALGLDTRRYKLFAFASSAFFAGLAGSFYAHYAGFISVEAFPPTLSITILVMAIIGGLGRIEGAVVGAVVVYALPEVLRFARAYWNVAFGVLLILIVLFLPDGLVSLPERLGDLGRRLLRLSPTLSLGYRRLLGRGQAGANEDHGDP